MPEAAPQISVCAPYWRRPDALAAMVETYEALYPHLDLELSICDDGSPEPAVVPHGTRHPVTLCHLPQKQTPLNPCIPINRAVAASRGDLVVLTNPEIEHPLMLLDEMLEHLEGPDDYVIARVRHRSRGRVNGLWLAGPEVNYGARGIQTPLPPGGHFHFLVLLHRALWDRAGGFDEDYRYGRACDDVDWLWRVYAAGARFKVTEGVAWHHRPNAEERLAWRGPHNQPLFHRKWPASRREAILAARAVA